MSYIGCKTPKYLSIVITNNVTIDIKISNAVSLDNKTCSAQCTDAVMTVAKPKMLDTGKLTKPTVRSETDCIMIKK